MSVKNLAWAMLAWSLLGQSVTVCAQRATGGGDTGGSAPGPNQEGLQEIVVTAQKREQRLLDVGETAVAVTGPELQAAGVVDINDLSKIVSGFTTTKSSYDYPIFSMRGVNLNLPYISA